MVGDHNCADIANEDKEQDHVAGNSVVENSFMSDYRDELENCEERGRQDGA